MGLVKNGENYQVAISLDGMWIFSKQGKTKLVVQNFLTGEQKQILNACSDSRRKSIHHVEMAAKSINGKWLILIFRDNSFTEWYLPEKEDTNLFGSLRGVSSNNRWALLETNSRNSRNFEVLDLFTGKIVHVIQKKYDNFDVSVDWGLWRKIVIFNDGNFVLMPIQVKNESGRASKDLVLWDLKNYPKIVTILQAYRDELFYSNNSNIFTIAVSADEQLCIVGFDNGLINIYDLKSDHKVYSCQEHKAPITSLAMSPNKQILISGTNNGIITVCNFQSQTTIDFKLDTVVNFKLDTEVTYCSFHSDQPFIIVGDIQEQIHLFEQVLSEHLSDENASQNEQFSTNVVSDQPTIISKRIRLQGICGEQVFFIKGNAIGPGNLQIELYNQNRIIYQYNEFIPEGIMLPLFPPFLDIWFPNEPWEEDLKGYIALQTPDNKFICRVDLTISCLITNLEDLKYYKYLVNYGDSYSLNKLLRFSERLFGPLHRKTEEAIDRLIECNKTLDKDSEIEFFQARKQQIKQNLKAEIVDITYPENQKIISYVGSYIILLLYPEDIIESDSQNSTHSDVEKINHNQAIDYKDSLGSELEEVWFLLKKLKEPGIDPFLSLAKAWKKLKLILSLVMVDYKEQLQKFLTNLREASMYSQLMLVLRNPKNLPYFTIAKIFSSFFVTIFLISTIANFSISNVSNWLGKNQILSNCLLLFWAIYLIVSYLLVIVVIPIYLRTFKSPDEEDVHKGWSQVILVKIINFLFISPFCLLGIIVGGVQGISLGMEVMKESIIEMRALINTDGYWFSIIATHCFSIFFAIITVLLGSWTEWIVRGKRKQYSFLKINDLAFLTLLTTLLGDQKYIGSLLWSIICCIVIVKLFINSETINYNLPFRLLLGVSIGIVFSVLIGNYFDGNSFESLIVRAVLGAIIGVFLRSTGKPMMLGALGGLTACISVSFSFNSSLKALIQIIKENIALVGLILIKGTKLLFGGGIGLLLGGIAGFWGGMLFGCCFTLTITIVEVGFFWLFFRKTTKVKIIKDFEERGYNPFFGVIFLILTAFLGSILGMIPIILSIAK